MARVVRIGGACPIDFALSLPQLVRGGNLHYLIIDFLSEFSLPLLVQNRAAGGAAFATGFGGIELAAQLPDIMAQGLRIVTNAGGLDPQRCAEALAKLAAEQGLTPRIAVVTGDDLMSMREELCASGCRDMFSAHPLPRDSTSINAYIGALPIAAALNKGADIVITGRAVDSALALGPLIHEFGWSSEDYDRLAAGTLVGHLLECGAQPVGGIFTDWRAVPDWTNSSFPIAECRADGTAVLTKVAGTGGLVSVGTVSEQAVYEIGDPQRYLMPDVTCDFSNVKVESVGHDRVRVSGARGYPPTTSYKAIATFQDGWRGTVSFVLRGLEAGAKAERVAVALLHKTSRMLSELKLAPWLATHTELIGSEASFGAHARVHDSREIVCRMVVDHESRRAIEMFLRVQRAISVSMAPGIATVPLGATVTPVFRVLSFLVEKNCVPLSIAVDATTEPLEVAVTGGFADVVVAPNPAVATAASSEDDVVVPLIRLAWARSGDKSDMANIAVIARTPEYLPWIKAALTPAAIGRWFAHLVERGGEPRVERFELPGLNALNFLLHGVLGGGGSASMRFDPMGKAIAQQLLEFPISISQAAASIATRQAPEAIESPDSAANRDTLGQVAPASR
jgi:hypothetical protein